MSSESSAALVECKGCGKKFGTLTRGLCIDCFQKFEHDRQQAMLVECPKCGKKVKSLPRRICSDCLAARKCIVCGASSKRYYRGMCSRCYQSAQHAVKTGKTTWEEIEVLGLSEPAISAFGIRGGRSAFAKKFDERAAAAGLAPIEQRVAASQGPADPATGECIDTITGAKVTFDESGDIGGGEDAGAPPDGRATSYRHAEQGGVVVHVPVPPLAGYLQEVSDSIEPQEVAQGPRNVPSGPPPWAR